jgi:hypothetical protein
MNSFIQRLLAPFSARWSKTRSTLAARGGDAGKRAFDALQELRDSETGKRAAGKISDLRDSETGKRAASKISDLRESDTGKRAATALADLRQRDPVRKAEEAARRTLHDLRSGGGPGDSSGAS